MTHKLVDFVPSSEIDRAVKSVIAKHGLTKEDFKRADDDGNKDGGEDEVLEELFSQKSVSPPPGESYVCDEREFYKSVLILSGLVSLVSTQSSLQTKLMLLDSSVDQQPENNIVFSTLTFVTRFLCPDMSRLYPEQCWTWVTEAVKTVLALTKLELDHRFINEASDICKEFLINILEDLHMIRDDDTRVLTVVKIFSHSRTLGKMITMFLFNKFLEVSDLLREARIYMIEDCSIMSRFHIYNQTLVEVWPEYVRSVTESSVPGSDDSSVGGKRRSSGSDAGGGKRRSSGINIARQKMSLTEFNLLVEELSQMRQMLTDCTQGLSIIHPEFYLAVTGAQQFISGMLQKLGKHK